MQSAMRSAAQLAAVNAKPCQVTARTPLLCSAGALPRRPLRPALSGSASSCAAAASSCCGGRLLHSTACLAGAPLLSSCSSKASRGRRAQLTVQAARGGGPDVQDRLLSAAPYLLPLLDGLRYSRFFFLQVPVAAKLFAPIMPLARLYYSLPFASIAAFFALYLGLVNNYNQSRFVRFNAAQAVVLDICLLLPSLLESLFKPGGGGVGLTIYINAYNTVWLFVACSVAYGMGSALLGRTARLPVVAEAADAQIRG